MYLFCINSGISSQSIPGKKLRHQSSIIIFGLGACLDVRGRGPTCMTLTPTRLLNGHLQTSRWSWFLMDCLCDNDPVPASAPGSPPASGRPGHNTWWGSPPSHCIQSPGSTCSPWWTPTFIKWNLMRYLLNLIFLIICVLDPVTCTWKLTHTR